MDLKTVEMGWDCFRVLEIYHGCAVWLWTFVRRTRR